MPESRSDLTLAAALRVMSPLVELLLHEGVTYPRFANALKKTFLDAAQSVLESNSARVNDSSVSVLSGVHRKDVREWRVAGRPRPQTKIAGAVMAVFTRWASDPDYCDEQGRPRILDRAGGSGSFESLAASVSNDVHPRAVLQELIRLGVVQMESESDSGRDKVSLCADAFVPKAGAAEMLQLFADNVGDHISTARSNLVGGHPPMLEQSVYADSLTPESAAALSALARQIWSSAFREFARKATVLDRQDRRKPSADQRIRFGMYYYHGPKDKR